MGSGVWAAAVTYMGVTSSIEKLSMRFDHIERNGWTYQEEREAWQEYAKLNPGEAIPDVKAIHSDARD